MPLYQRLQSIVRAPGRHSAGNTSGNRLPVLSVLAGSRAVKRLLLCSTLIAPGLAFAAENDRESQFSKQIYPVLDQFCSDCHDPEDSKGNVLFLEAEKADDIRRMRGVWRSAGAQLRQRTMPPPDKKQPSDEERDLASNWIENFLRETACLDGPYAGNVMTRRLNRLDYNNTVKDLIGVDLHYEENFPLDSGAGEGFNNNGESLYLPPMLMERYLEAAQQIVDAAIASPALDVTLQANDLYPQPAHPKTASAPRPVHRDDGLSALVSTYVEADYLLDLTIRHGQAGSFDLLLDGVRAHRFTLPAGEGPLREAEASVKIRLVRGTHALTIKPIDTQLPKLEAVRVRLRSTAGAPASSLAATHEKLLGLPPGKVPEHPRDHARVQLAALLKKAYRRPVAAPEVDRIMALYDRAEKRGDPFAEAMKLAIKGILVSPDFLFRIEQEPNGPGIHPVTDHELAVRLSYFLWSTMPDAELTRLADAGKLQNEEELRRQTRRLAADPRAIAFAREFIGQWLGTKDVGGRVAPTTETTKEFYTPEIATDMREEGVNLFHYIVSDNRSILELIDADYTFATRRLAKYYGLTDIDKSVNNEQMVRVSLPDHRRGGVLGLGAVLTMTSHPNQTSPVMRGAWVFDTLLGTPVPPPPANVPPLKKENMKKMTVREQLDKHRQDKACLACHRIIDPIGFGLENFDSFGRWRDTDMGKPVDASGVMPSGDRFSGPIELKKVLLSRKQDLSRQLVRKLMGYGLGRSLSDWDDCTIAELQQVLESNGYKAVPLLEALVLSTPFRNRQETDK